MNINAVSIGKNPPEDINVVVEIPLGGQPIKYELDKDSGFLFVDRFLHTPMSYPGNYGFIPHTLAEDGDPLDVLIFNTRPLLPGCVINTRPIGILIMEDDGGKDEKIISVPESKLTKRYINFHSYNDIPDIVLKQIEYFFKHYKDLEQNKWVKIIGWKDKNFAFQTIIDSIDRNLKIKSSKN